MTNFDSELRGLIQKVENRNHSDEDFISELSNVIQTFNRNAEKNSVGMKDAVLSVLKKSVESAKIGQADAPPIPVAPQYVTNGVGHGADWRQAIPNIDRQVN